MAETIPALQTRGVSLTFQQPTGLGRTRPVHAVCGVDLSLHTGRTVALVGESGSGKTTLARILAGFYEPTSGDILLGGHALPRGATASHAYRTQVQLMFQDPFASLNSAHTVAHTVGRALARHTGRTSRDERRQAVLELLRRVRLEPAQDFLDKHPHQLSGGQRQRVVLARALAVGPKVLLADEPVSMLDVSIRAEVLNLLRRLRDEQGLSLLYVTHDMASARYIADEIAVMYRGRIVERGPAHQLVSDPQHPYTRLLVESAPDPSRVGLYSRAERFAVTTPSGRHGH
jgi:peptide/nickel transport system ATP-binding protein